MLMRFAEKFVSGFFAEDIVHDVFLKLCQGFRSNYPKIVVIIEKPSVHILVPLLV